MSIISINTIRNIVATTSVASLLFISTSVNAASQCKGMENKACLQESSCSWVAGYERKDGRKVNAFCRSKAKSKATSAVTLKNNKAS